MNQIVNVNKRRLDKELQKQEIKDEKRLLEFASLNINLINGNQKIIKNDSQYDTSKNNNKYHNLIPRKIENRTTDNELSYFTNLTQEKSNEGSFASMNCYSQEVRELSYDEQIAQRQLEEVRQQSWSQQIKQCGPLNLKLGCFETCTNWTLNMSVLEKGKKQMRKLIKIPATSTVKFLHNWKNKDRPYEYSTSDLISQMVLRQDIERVFKQDSESLLEEYNLENVHRNSEFAFQSQNQSSQSEQRVQHEFLPIQPSYNSSSKLISNLKPNVSLCAVDRADCLICLEFKIIKDPEDRLAPIRLVDMFFNNSEFFFEIAGYIHGKKVLSEPIQLQVQGKSIIKSIEERIKDFQEIQYQVGWTYDTKRNGYLDFMVPYIGDERVAFEYYSPKLQKLQDFQPQSKRITQSNSQLKRMFFQLAFNFPRKEENSPNDQYFIGLFYIFEDLLKKRKEERERLRKKRYLVLKGNSHAEFERSIRKVTFENTSQEVQLSTQESKETTQIETSQKSKLDKFIDLSKIQLDLNQYFKTN